MSIKVAGAVVLYQPNDKVKDNINSYINNLEELFVIDNSNVISSSIINSLKSNSKIKYHWNRGNKGIAYALNYASRGAIQRGYEWLILFDQDSIANPEMLPRIKEYIQNNETTKVGIVSANQKIDTEDQERSFGDYEYCDLVITSGSTINLKAFQHIGGFNQKLFIDMVDHEYCLRLKLNGYKIIKVMKAYLYHEVGKSKLVKGRLISLHSENRVYYFVRNLLYVRKNFAKTLPDLVDILTKGVILRCKNNLIYGDNKLKQVRSIVKGIFDYTAGRWGE